MKQKLIHYKPGAVRYWIAINAHTCALSAIPATVIPHTIPVATNLIGFRSLEQAREAQRHLLTDPIERCEESVAMWKHDENITFVVNEKPDPPTTGTTLWMFKPSPKERAAQRKKRRKRR